MAVVVVDSLGGIVAASTSVTASLVAAAGTSVIASQAVASLAASLVVAAHTFAAGTWATAHTFVAEHSKPDTTVGSKLGSTVELA